MTPRRLLGSKRNVITDTEHASMELDGALSKFGHIPIQAEHVYISADCEEFGDATVQGRPEHLQRGHDARFVFVLVYIHRIDRGVTGQRRVIAIVSRQILE